MNKKGNILILFVWAAAAFLLLSILFSRWAQGVITSERARIVAEETLSASLRIKAEGLGQIAKSWEDLLPYLGPAFPEGVRVSSTDWSIVRQISLRLKNSLTGYKSRIKSASTVVAEANGINRAHILRDESPVFDLGVVSQGQWAIDSSGRRVWIEALWLKRTWDPVRRLGQPFEEGTHHAKVSDPFWGELTGRARARIMWDVPLTKPSVAILGNGGFPRSWEEARNNDRLDPYRWPYFRWERSHGSP